jgi:adenylylsulfate kinase
MAQLLVVHSKKSVVIDATGNRRAYRELARRLITEFAEVYVACPMEVCKERESLREKGSVQSDLYRKASQGVLEGGMPGVTAPYEVPENPEIEVSSDILSPRESAGRIMAYITSRWV